MATLLAHITVRPGTEARFEQIACELWTRTHADEPAAQHYEYWRGSEPRTYYTLVSYPDHRTFIEHQASDHHEAAVPKLGDIVERIRLEWLDPVAGASDLPPTVMQPAPPGADDFFRSHTDRYAADIAAWWPARPE